MLIENLYVYPIKSMRGVSLDTATLTKYGFTYDRSFMILQVTDENGDKTLKNMTVANYNEMVRFFPEIDTDKGALTVTYKPIDGGAPNTIEIPLEPDTTNLEVIDVEMHKSPTKAFKMDAKYNDWVSSCFGYDAILAYIGSNTRQVRMSNGAYKSPAHPGASTNGAINGTSSGGGAGWLSSITSAASKASEMIMGSEKPAEIKFSDVAPYLVASSKSMEDVHSRLPEGEKFDITKFRPNVIVSGAKEVWEEDFWGELTIGEAKAKLVCEHNCGRCRSINIDYDTGAQGTGEAGSMLKKLMRDRRVDKGAKWIPVFGRYSFLPPEHEGDEISIGDEVVVSKQNTERTAFDWQGLSTLPGGGRD